MRMDIVLFEEQVYHLDKVQELAFNADLFVSIGTSNNVWPASSIIHIFKERKKPTIELNLEKTNISHLFDHSIVGKKAEESVTEFKDYMLDLNYFVKLKIIINQTFMSDENADHFFNTFDL